MFFIKLNIIISELIKNWKVTFKSFGGSNTCHFDPYVDYNSKFEKIIKKFHSKKIAAGLQKCLERPSPPDTGTIVFWQLWEEKKNKIIY